MLAKITKKKFKSMLSCIRALRVCCFCLFFIMGLFFQGTSLQVLVDDPGSGFGVEGLGCSVFNILGQDTSRRTAATWQRSGWLL